MTPRKENTTIPKTVSAKDALAGWWRVSDSPAGRILPDSLATTSEMPGLASPFDLWCWKRVNEALAECAKKRMRPAFMRRILVHVCTTGGVWGFQLMNVVATSTESDAQDAPGLAGADLALAVRCTYHTMMKTIETAIERADSYIEVAEALTA